MGMIALWSDTDLGPDQKTAWGWFNGFFYVKLKPGADVAAINDSLEAWKERNAPKKNVGGAIMMIEQSTVLVVAFALLFTRMLARSEEDERRRERLEDAAAV